MLTDRPRKRLARRGHRERMAQRAAGAGDGRIAPLLFKPQQSNRVERPAALL